VVADLLVADGCCFSGAFRCAQRNSHTEGKLARVALPSAVQEKERREIFFLQTPK
jgi:hypothetical protein